MTTEYIALRCQLVGNLESWSTAYDWDGERLPSRQAAVNHGWDLWDHDDFRIGILTDGKLTGIGWGLDIDFDPVEEDLPDIARQLALECGPMEVPRG